MQLDWQALMRAAQGGDKGAYDTLLRSLSGWLRAYFSALARPADIDDLVQETLLAIHTKRATYDPKYPFMPWLKTIARHKWIDRTRSLVRRFFGRVQSGANWPHCGCGRPSYGQRYARLCHLQQSKP